MKKKSQNKDKNAALISDTDSTDPDQTIGDDTKTELEIAQEEIEDMLFGSLDLNDDKSEPTKSESTKPEPTKSEPTNAKAAKPEPTKSKPIKAKAAKSEPAKVQKGLKKPKEKKLVSAVTPPQSEISGEISQDDIDAILEGATKPAKKRT